MKRIFLSGLKEILTIMLMMMGVCAWGETVTYTVTTGPSVTTSGTAPTNSSATLAGTYSSGSIQMTSGKSSVLTLSGYTGYKITGITLKVKSNSSSGAGYFTAVAGSTTIASIADSRFNTSNWHGAWFSSSSVSKVVTMTDANYSIKTNENVVLTITASENSLYVTSWIITYEQASNATLSSISIGGNLTKSTYIEGDDFDYSGLTLTGTYSDNTTSDLTSAATWTVTPEALTTSTTSVTVKASYGGKDATKECAVTVNERTTVVWDLTKKDYADANSDEVNWKRAVAEMKLVRSSSYTAANYLAGYTSNLTNTGFYEGQTLTITPANGIEINSIMFTCVSTYADELANSTWSNATATYSGTTVTVTPTDGTKAITCTISSATHVTGVTITYIYTQPTSITLGANGYSTFCCKYPFTVSGADAYFATRDNETVTLHAITGAVPAWTAVILKGTEGATATVTQAATAEAISGNSLVAVTTTTTAFEAGTNYVLSTNSSTKETAFVKMASGKTVAEMLGKAYLNIPAGSAKPVLFFDDSATGVVSVNKESSVDNTAYNIIGQRVNAKVKGVVIVKGRKYIIR